MHRYFDPDYYHSFCTFSFDSITIQGFSDLQLDIVMVVDVHIQFKNILIIPTQIMLRDLCPF